VILRSFGWCDEALKQGSEILSPTKINKLNTLEINDPPTSDNLQKII